MRQPLRVAAAQPPVAAHDVATNARVHADVVRAAGARLVVFPELSLTGYELDADPVPAGDHRLEPLVRACAETGAVALAGAPVPGGGDRENPSIAVLAVDAAGATVVYRKMWLGGPEPDRFAPGTEPAVFDVDGWRLGLAVCKDTGVARHAADTVALGVDGYVAGVLESADDAAVPAERACRVTGEHGVWVVVASFAGSTGGGYAEAAGGSGIWAPDGSVLDRAGPEPGAVVTAVLGREPAA
ncbi:putative amidohydrolase [Haloactinopolyspora alba]|uniref:Putative amidohydrolase n=1 Tax=Haloactinopolyspora alba TaxID=648780 RepID=A0A2P8DEG5_9ACTN|nr:carbon-nitrogen hydrolase family protein [Haloactinopolyspora alba]PSK95567.1 putative amidohydrolase [Haloactinopolyspora alba]